MYKSLNGRMDCRFRAESLEHSKSVLFTWRLRVSRAREIEPPPPPKKLTQNSRVILPQLILKFINNECHSDFRQSLAPCCGIPTSRTQLDIFAVDTNIVCSPHCSILAHAMSTMFPKQPVLYDESRHRKFPFSYLAQVALLTLAQAQLSLC